jgi:putative peptidoglycan lipid II flippase
MFTDLAALISREEMPAFRAAFRRDAGYLLAIIVPFAVVAAVKSRDIVAVLYERGRFDAAATSMTASALVMYSIGLPTLGMNMLLGRVFHAMKEMKARMVIDLAWLASNVIVALALIKPLGVAGLALGTSVASMVNVVLAMLYLRRKRGGVGGGAVARVFFESLAAGGVMAALVAVIPLDGVTALAMSAGLGGAPRIATALALCAIGALGTAVYALALVALRHLGNSRARIRA